MPRRKNDFYPTPAYLTQELLKRVSISGTVLEPCSGAGDMSNVLLEAGLDVTTNDIDTQMPSDEHLDATLPVLYNVYKSDWVVSNPPFSHALPIVERSIASGANVAMLLRLSFLEPTFARSPLLGVNPPHEVIVCPRTSFTGDGKTDSTTCAWMVWYNRDMPQKISVIPK